MKRLSVIFVLCLMVTACGTTNTDTGNQSGADGGATTSSTKAAASPSKLSVKVGGKDATLDVKSGVVDLSEMAFTAPGKPTVKTSTYTIYLTNYEMDTQSPGPIWMRKPLATPEHMRVAIQLTGEDGTTKDSPVKVGTYSAQANQVNGVRSVMVISSADGKQTEMGFKSLMGLGDKKASGEVKIASVTADTVSGEVNLTEGDNSLKGTFTAKLPAAKK
jgi:hypothetical protein